MAEDRCAEGYAVGRDGNGGGFGFGGEWGGLIGLLIVASLFGGGGIGFGGGRGQCATQADLAAGFNNSAVLSGLNDIKLGQSQAINYNNQGFAGLNTALCTLGYNVTHQISDCCCQTQRAIDGVNYNMAKSTCDIIQAGNANTQRLIDYFTGEKIAALQAQNAALTAQLSQNSQTATLLNAINRTPVPAYVVANPYCCNTYQGCGCGA